MLCELYVKSELATKEANPTNPFLPFFIDAVEGANSSEDGCEKLFVRDLLINSPQYKKVGRKEARF